MFQEFYNEKQYGYILQYHGTYWSIKYHKGLFFGTCENVINYSIDVLGFKGNELWRGIELMENAFHNCCLFDSFKIAVQTYDIENKYAG